MPLTTPDLGLQASELKSMVNPTGDPMGFTYSNDPGKMSEQAVINLMTSEEQSMLSKIPEDYAVMARGHIDGAHITDSRYGANGGETTFKIPLAPLKTGTLRLFKNYHTRSKPWRSRTAADAMSAFEYQVDEITGDLILAEPLVEGDKLIAEWQHSGAGSLQALKQLALKASRIELYIRFPNWAPDNTVITELRDQLESEILSFYGPDGSARGINELDRIVLVHETRQSTRKPIRMPFMGGW